MNKEERKLYMQKYRASHREEHNKYNKNWLRELKHWAVDKLGRKCSKCGLVSEHDCIYDFHHLGEDSWMKEERNASNMRAKELFKWRQIDEIPEDVILLCSNCHRIEHITK